MNIYIVRHGETEANVKKLVCGQLDTPLTQQGIEQAKKLAHLLADVEFDLCFTTPLQRAYKTAELSFPKHKFEKIAQLMETNTGEASEIREEDFIKENVLFKNHGFNFNLKYPGGESIADVYHRMSNWIDSIFQNNPDAKNILIVGHFATVSMLLHYLLEVPLQLYPAFHLDNASYTKIVCDLESKRNRLFIFNKRPEK